MLAENTVRTVEHLLKSTELSQREIARRMKINRETVNRIANGKRFDVHAYKRQQASKEPRRLVEAIRCPECGGRINIVPCQVCKLHKQSLRKGVRRIHRTQARQALASLPIDLKGKERDRYLAIRARKIRRGEKPADNLKLLSLIANLGDETMPAFQNVKYVRWFLAHVKELLPLLELPDQLKQATTIQEKWQLVKQAGDILAGVLAEFPVVESGEIRTQQDLEVEVEAMGIPWQQLESFLPLLIRLIALLQGETEND